MLGTLVVKCQTRGEHPVYTVAFMPVDRRMGDLPELRFEGDLAVLKALERFVTTPARFLEVIKGLRDAGQSYVSDIVLSPAQTARFALHGAVARPKCTRCSRPVTDDPVIYAEEVFHTHCWQVFSSEAQIVESRRRIRKGKSVIEKSRGRFERAAPALFETAVPICRVCLNVIQPSDQVSAHGLIHAQCDYPIQTGSDPDSPGATLSLPTDRDTE